MREITFEITKRSKVFFKKIKGFKKHRQYDNPEILTAFSQTEFHVPPAREFNSKKLPKIFKYSVKH